MDDFRHEDDRESSTDTFGSGCGCALVILALGVFFNFSAVLDLFVRLFGK